MRTIEPSELARNFAATWGKDPRQVEVVLRESVRIVRMDRGIHHQPDIARLHLCERGRGRIKCAR